MKYVKQLLIILLFSFAGELLNKFLPFPVPASVYGMILLLIALLTGLVKLFQIRETADFLLGIMPIFFICPTARLMDEYVTVIDYLIPFLVLCVVSTFAALACTGYVAQFIIRITGKSTLDGENAATEGIACEKDEEGGER